MIIIFVFIFLLRFKVGVQPPAPTASQIVTDYLASISPWSTFTFNGVCNVYQGVKLNTSQEPGANLGNGFVCTPSSNVAGIQASRTCNKTGCVDLNGIPRDIGYVETAYVDCSYPYTCELSQAGCFVPIVSCDYYGNSSAYLQYNQTCTAFDTTREVVVGTPCSDAQDQQWLLVPDGELYNIIHPNGKCLTVDATSKQLQVSGCGSGRWYLAKQAPITVIYKLPPLPVLKLPAIMPQQLIWSPTGEKLAIPTEWNPLETTFDWLTLQGGQVGAYIPACSNDSEYELPGCPSFLITSAVLS